MIFDSIGPIRVVEEAAQLTPKIAVYKTDWYCKRYSNGKRIHAEVGKTMHLDKLMADDQKRNLLIMKIIKSAYDCGRRIVVFSSLKIHLRFLQETVASGLHGIPLDDTALYISGLTKKQREVAKTKRVMFATWGMMGEGTDIEWLDTCILATPRANVDQPIGRILREFPDKPQPVVVDIQDWDHHVIEKYSKKRLKLYAAKGAVCKNYSIEPPS
jgi:superfamily II DNA or RNA helicase